MTATPGDPMAILELSDNEINYLQTIVGRDLHRLRRNRDDLMERFGNGVDAQTLAHKESKVEFVQEVFNKLGIEL